MAKSSNPSSASAFILLSILLLPDRIQGQTALGLRIVQNDDANFKVAVVASTQTSPSTMGSATIDVLYDHTVLAFVGMDPLANAIWTHDNNWFAACMDALSNASTCGGAIPHSIIASPIVEDHYVRVTILPALGPYIGDSLEGFLVDGFEVPSSDTVMFQLNFAYLSPPGPTAPAGAMTAVDVSIDEGTASFGYFESLDNSSRTNKIIDDCGGAWWGVGNGCTFSSPSLPVELATLSALTDEGDVVLKWETSSESNNAGFSIEHAARERDFEEIQFVEGHGSSNKPHTYSHRVEGLDVGTHRFRLKQLDYDGAFTYSEIVEATIELAGTHRLGAAYPNPFNPSTTFELVVGRNQQVKIDIFNALGQRVLGLFDGQMDANKPTNFTFDAATLPSGLYFYRATGEYFIDTRRALLVK